MDQRLSRAFAVAAALCGLTACALLLPVSETPVVATAHPSAAIAGYEARFAALLAHQDATRLRYQMSLRPDDTLPAWLAAQLGPVEARGMGVDGGRIAAMPGLQPGAADWQGQWRESRATLYLTDGPVAAGLPFLVSGQNALRRVIAFRSRAALPAAITATCDGAVTLTQGDARHAEAAGGAVDFAVAAGERDHTVLHLGTDTTTCHLVIGFAGQSPRRLEIIAADDPAIRALDGRFDICAEPAPATLDPLAQVFFAGRWLSQTCAMDPGALRLLPEAPDGFAAKVAALTGQVLTPAQIAAGDPDMVLDFSNAPRLDLIYLSYLDLKADFSGAIIARALAHHAARGTPIRILVSDMLEQAKDRDLYEGLAATWPNVQLQLFAWTPPPFAPLRDDIAALHRVHHVKLFAALSSDPGRSLAILGGRNIHDGFLFDAALDLSAHPELQNYGAPGELSLNYFSTYHDFEIALSDDRMVRTLAAHLSTFWQRDPATTMFRPFSIGTPAGSAAPAVAARHFLSAPYIDGGALEQYWVELIDAATLSVEIATPYLNPTPAIEAALLRAVARGVAVTIVARVELHGDLGGTLMTQMNMLFVARYADHLTLWEYRAPAVVLHSKMLLIDGRLSVLSSVNLNHRSFLHDTENGIAVLDPQVYARVRAVMQGYIDQSDRRTSADAAVHPAMQALFDSPGVRDLF